MLRLTAEKECPGQCSHWETVSRSVVGCLTLFQQGNTAQTHAVIVVRILVLISDLQLHTDSNCKFGGTNKLKMNYKPIFMIQFLFAEKPY